MNAIYIGPMCRINEVNCSFIKLVTLFLPRDSMGQSNFVHGEGFEVQHEICRFQAWSLKDTQNLFEC